MGNTWINRLEVRGPAPDVETFARAASKGRRQRLSFVALTRQVPASLARRLDPDPEEPSDLGVDPAVRLNAGMLEQRYRFQLGGFEPDELLARVSTLYPRLCFVLGWVDPNSCDHASKFIHDGRVRQYRLPEKRHEELTAHIPFEDGGDEDEIFWELAKADWAMMDEVCEHWNKAVKETLSRIAKRPRRKSVPPRGNVRPATGRRREGRRAR